MRFIVLYGFPFIADIIVSLVLFVGRHSLAGRGYDEVTVGSILLFYGLGYVIASLLMTRIIRPAIAKAQMLFALASIVIICIVLANVEQLRVVQALYCIFPFATSLYFNAFQVYMLGMSEQDGRSLAMLAGHFTFSWSIGYAVGPFISSLMRTVVGWSVITYVAAGLATLIGLTLYGFDPARRSAPEPTSKDEVPQPSTPAAGGRISLIGPAWLGLLVGWTAYNVILIYWPVQAVQRAIPADLRGMVEFASAMAQGLAALALTALPGWHHRPAWLARFGGLAVIALVVLGTVDGTLGFLIGAILIGAFTGSMFSAIVYHSMFEPAKAVRRIPINEVVVGICFLISSPVAKLIHKPGTPFSGAYLLLAAVVAVGIMAETIYAAVLNRRTRSALSEAVTAP